jgi:predicted DNA-binding protein YlxM (UPF0122 family)
MIKDKQKEILIEYISQGASITDSAKMAGITRDAIYKNPELRERVEQAEIQFKVGNIKIIKKASNKLWTAAAWLLERKYGDEFALKQKLQHSGELVNPLLKKLEELGENSNYTDNVDNNEPDVSKPKAE